MLSGTSIGLLKRSTSRFRSFSIPKSRASLSTTTIQQYSTIPVVSYRDGQRKEGDVAANTEANGPVTPPGSDLQKIAQPVNPSIYSQLTPTLTKFMLRDKVAVITG
jgi:hypothetical protein